MREFRNAVLATAAVFVVGIALTCITLLMG